VLSLRHGKDNRIFSVAEGLDLCLYPESRCHRDLVAGDSLDDEGGSLLVDAGLRCYACSCQAGSYYGGLIHVQLDCRVSLGFR
jgi:hypothetical protein